MPADASLDLVKRLVFNNQNAKSFAVKRKVSFEFADCESSRESRLDHLAPLQLLSIIIHVPGSALPPDGGNSSSSWLRSLEGIGEARLHEPASPEQESGDFKLSRRRPCS